MFSNQLFSRFKGKTYSSKVNEPIRVGWSFGKKAIFAGDIPQSGGEFIYEWDTVIGIIRKREYSPKNCLLLGVAGGTAINSLRKFYPDIQILGIELDPVIINVALEHGLFKVDKKTILKIADGIEWVGRDKNKYDLVIADLYLGDQNVEDARKDAFLKRIRSLLCPNGIILYSCHYNGKRKGEYIEFMDRLRSIYTKVEVVFTFPKNKVVLIEK